MVYDSPSISAPALITLSFVSMLYGMHLLVFPAAMSILLRRHLSRKSVIFMLIAVIFMFIMSTILVVTLFVSTIMDGTIFGIYFTTGPLTARAMLLMWPRNMNLICGDAVVVWRMLVLYRSRSIRYGMITILLGYSGLAIFNSTGEPRDGPFEEAVLRGNIATFLSVIINLTATLMISWKAWQLRHLDLLERYSQRLSPVNNALMVLVETGFLYLAWQLLVGTVSQISNSCTPNTQWCLSTQFAANTLVESTTIVAGLYPTLTMVIIALKYSISDRTEKDFGSNHQSPTQPPVSIKMKFVSVSEISTDESSSRFST